MIRVHAPLTFHQEFIAHADLILNSPPKTRPLPPADPPHRMTQSSVSYHGVLSAQTTNTHSVAIQPNGSTLTTLQTSQTVTSILETRFQTIEKEVQDQRVLQHNMEQCLQKVEVHASAISDDIAAMMAHWKITPSGERKHDSSAEGNVGHANHPILTDQDKGDTYV